MLVRGSPEGTVFGKLESSFVFIFLTFKGLHCQWETIHLSLGLSRAFFSHHRLCALKVSCDLVYKSHLTVQRQRGPEVFEHPNKDSFPLIWVKVELGTHLIVSFTVNCVYSKDIANCSDLGTEPVNTISRDTKVQGWWAHCNTNRHVLWLSVLGKCGNI